MLSFDQAFSGISFFEHTVNYLNKILLKWPHWHLLLRSRSSNKFFKIIKEHKELNDELKHDIKVHLQYFKIVTSEYKKWVQISVILVINQSSENVTKQLIDQFAIVFVLQLKSKTVS